MVGHPAVGIGAVAQSIDGGLTFTPSLTAYVPLTLTAVACPTSAACVAVGGDTVARVRLIAPRAQGTTPGVTQATPVTGVPPGTPLTGVPPGTPPG